MKRKTQREETYSTNGNGQVRYTGQLNSRNTSDGKLTEGIPIDELWEQYKKSGSSDVELRNYFIEHYQHLIKSVAKRMPLHASGDMDSEDIESDGLFGLIDAIEAYDLGRGVKFETYAPQRIRGAILDELRATDPIPRLMRTRKAKFSKAKEEIEKETVGPATNEEIRKRLDVSESEFKKIKRDSRAPYIVRLGTPAYNNDYDEEPTTTQDIHEDKKQKTPLAILESKDNTKTILRGLSNQEKLIMVLCHVEGISMREAGEHAIGITEAGVSKANSKLLGRLRAKIELEELVA